MTAGFSVEVAKYNWGPAHLTGTTEATWIRMIVSASGAIRVLGFDMGPETESMTGHYDYGYWIDIPVGDAQLFTACVLHKALDHDGALNFEQFKNALSDWGVNFSEGDGPYSSNLEVIA